MLIRIDPGSPEPLFTQVTRAVRAEIASGRIAVGERLPSAREIAQSLQINLHTVLHAYQDLRDEGLIELRRGRGAVVVADAAALSGLRDDIDALVAKAAAAGVSADTLSALVKEAAHGR